MNLLSDVSCSEVEPQEIRLHSLHEGGNAGSLLGTRRQALFLPHCRRGVQSHTQQYLPGCIRQVCRNSAATQIQSGKAQGENSCLSALRARYCPCQAKRRSTSGSSLAKTTAEIAKSGPSRPQVSQTSLCEVCR